MASKKRKKGDQDSTIMTMDATSLLMHTMPWLVISFIVNLVAYSPLYFIYPAIKAFVTKVINPQELIYNWLAPMLRWGGAPNLVNKLAIGADFILVMFWTAIALGLSAVFMKFMANYFTYLMKAGHIANVTSILQGEKQKNQFLYGFDRLLSRFGSFNLMFVADGLTKKTVRKVNNKMFASEGTPDFINRFGILKKNLPKFLEMLLTHVDETILSYVMMTEGNVWSLYASAIVSYVKAWKELVKSALSTIVTLWVIEVLIKIGVYGTFFMAMKNYDWWTIMVAFGLARYVLYVIKITFIDAYKYTKILIAFYTHSEEADPSDPMFKKLSGIASFNSIMNRSKRDKVVDDLAKTVEENLDFKEEDLGTVGKVINDKLIPDKNEEGRRGWKDIIGDGVDGIKNGEGKKETKDKDVKEKKKRRRKKD